MRATFALIAASLVASVQAHFTLNYPLPRGPFNDDNEVKFCDGYNSVNTTRQAFPLKGGMIAMYSEHSDWNVEVVVSTLANPQSLTDFNTSSTSGIPQAAIPPYHATGEGVFCLPIDIANLDLKGVQDGSNVTIQVIYNGGDGILYQCADLTLSSNVTTPSNSTLQCQTSPSNVPLASAVPNTTASGSGSSPSSTSPSSSSPTSKGNGAAGINVPAWAGLFGLAAAFAL